MILIAPYIISIVLDKNWWFEHTLYIYLGFIAILISAIFDTARIFKILYLKFSNSKFVKVLLWFFGLLFTYIIFQIVAERFAREHIYYIVGFIPDNFILSIRALSLFYSFFVIVIFIILVIYMLFIVFIMIDYSKTLKNKLVEYFKFVNQWHIVFYIIMGIFSIIWVISLMMGKLAQIFIYIPHLIYYLDYYPNNTHINGKICSKVEGDFHIKLLGDNKVSVTLKNKDQIIFITKDCD
ncbi:hypothetical protein cje146_07213 [Campylobacter jejuni subsp. jejuni 2008-894]|uniref:hypothetical protein n=1 Tax=Campylobacter TaxID=194 RepID=UPI00025890E6|nr:MULTISPECIES: hypothetical protein [Campylobacter]PCM52887.1 hypothetical protein CP501_03745 [Campylobacter sp. BCW_8709]EIB46514.1 hypothetical protein cje146_07213 [Campylobacter jejuni subsp. jejuni 2008-894]EKQ8596810.1 hypothetical protein [Campylobacter jejuni]MCH3850116.1 hypothetical protein [Campylobacter jejuni]MCH3862873.1 hypothetical protein [Campylobacter jejuni]